MDDKRYFPMFVDLSRQKAVVVGAGKIAARRAAALVQFCPDVTVIAPEISPGIERLEQEQKVKVLRKEYRREDIFGADLVIAATSRPEVNDDIYAACKTLGIRVNVCSDRSKCDFYFPATVVRDDVVIGIGSSGKDPKISKQIREKIEALLEEG